MLRPRLSDFEVYSLVSRPAVPKGLAALYADLAWFGALRQVPAWNQHCLSVQAFDCYTCRPELK